VATRPKPLPERKRRYCQIALEGAQQIGRLMPEAQAVITQALRERQEYRLPPTPWTEQAARIVFETAYNAAIIETQMILARLED
jgi:hypothetical protein